MGTEAKECHFSLWNIFPVISRDLHTSPGYEGMRRHEKMKLNVSIRLPVMPLFSSVLIYSNMFRKFPQEKMRAHPRSLLSAAVSFFSHSITFGDSMPSHGSSTGVEAIL